MSAAVVFVVAAGLPVAGNWARGSRKERCALDGVRIEPIFRVRIFDPHGQADQFCCVACAELWLQRQTERHVAIYVTDEVTGSELDAPLAYFVRSSVITTPHTGNRIHVFWHRSDAEQHASVARGTVLMGSDRPLQHPK